MAEKNQIDAKTLLETLDYPMHEDIDMVVEAYSLFAQNLQIVMDLYLKVCPGRTTGEAEFSIKFLFARCINDIMVGFYLAKQGYFIQCYTVIRPILESLDKIELFKRDKKWAEMWVHRPEEAREKLKPGKVRVKLGRDSYDEVYGYLCEVGSHPTFLSRHGMIAESVQSSEVHQINIWIGGVKFEHTFIFSFTICFLLLELVLSKMLIIYGDKLTETEILSSRKTTQSNFSKFFTGYAEPFFESYDIDAQEIVALLKSLAED